MKLEEIKTIAREHSIKIGKMPKDELIRAIQSAEGNLDCFGSESRFSCEQGDCLWLKDCQGK